MSVYLNKNEIEKLCEQFKGEFDRYSKYVSIYLKTNDNEYTEFIQFKRRNSNDFKIIWFCDEILHDKLNNVMSKAACSNTGCFFHAQIHFRMYPMFDPRENDVLYTSKHRLCTPTKAACQGQSP